MRRRIIIGLSLYTVAFLLAGGYILKIIHDATTKLDNLIMLHQVEILREHYLIQIRRVQTDLAVRDTLHEPNFDTIVAHARSMAMVVNTCFDCHHSGPVAARIESLKHQTERYEESLSRVLTIRANAARVAEEEDAAFHIGEELIQQVSEMIAITGARLEAATQRALGEIRGTRSVLIALVAAGPLVSVALGLVLVTGLTKPVKLLLSSTRRLKAGDLDHRVVGLRDEFGELGDAFNEMAASLKDQMLKMQRAEQMMLVGGMAAGLAHEIKNPLAGIKAAMEIMEGEGNLPDEDRDVIRQVIREVGRLEGLMKSFLNFARPPKPQPTEIDVNELVSTTLALYEKGKRIGQRDAGAIEVVKELGAASVVMADPMQLQQVLLNLFINGVEAMPDGGRLTVTTLVEPAPGAVRIDVADTGRGLDPELVEKIFLPFYTTKPKGTGLGLAISRQLIEQHGGSLTVGANPGGGTVFTVRLPAQTERKGAAA